MTLDTICRLNDLSQAAAEKALASLQEKGLVSGYVPGNMTAEITITATAKPYLNQSGS